MSRIQYGRWAVVAVALVVQLAACQGDVRVGFVPEDLECGELNPLFLADGGVGRDGIPALTNPAFVPIENGDGTNYLNADSRVIGVFVDGEWLAVPHNIMYRHEIVNLDRGSEQVAITYCPLTGSALAFDRSSVDGAEFGVSGLLFQANLIMYDRSADDSLWPQMQGAAACGSRTGQSLVRLPVVEMTWDGWKNLFTGASVVGVDPIDVDRYSVNPYGTVYEHHNNPDYLGFPIPRDDVRRPPKERVLGLPARVGADPIAFPFLAMEARGRAWVYEFDYAGEPAAVFWDASSFAAVALRPVVGGQTLTFRVEDDVIVDNETGSQWSVAGEAVSGSLEGGRLPGIPEAYVAFWLAWAAFHPGTELMVE